MPRRKDPKPLILEKKIRTLAWYKHIELKEGADNPNQLAAFKDSGYRKWSYYAKGEKTPNQKTLERAEEKYPGSLIVFDHGPESSGLFDAMFGDLYQNMNFWMFASPEQSHRYLWPGQELRIYPSFQELYDYLNTLSIELKKLNAKDKFYRFGGLKILAHLSNFFRYSSEASKFTYNYSVNYKCHNIITQGLKHDIIIEELTEFNIRDEYKIWLGMLEYDVIPRMSDQAIGRHEEWW